MTAKTSTTPTLLVSQPGILNNSLLTLLRSLPNIEVIDSVSGGLSAINLLKVKQVELLIIDTNLPVEEVLVLLAGVKKSHPHIRCLVLTLTTNLNRKLLAAGADDLLPRYSSTQEFMKTVQKIKPS